MSTANEAPVLHELMTAIGDLTDMDTAGLGIALLTQSRFFLESAAEDAEQAPHFRRVAAVLLALARLLPQMNTAKKNAELMMLIASYYENTSGSFLGDVTEMPYDEK